MQRSGGNERQTFQMTPCMSISKVETTQVLVHTDRKMAMDALDTQIDGVDGGKVAAGAYDQFVLV